MNGKNNNRPAVSLADMESDIGNASLEEEATSRHDSRACLHIHSYRKRLADPDGVSAKAVIDGIVKAGVIKDDSAQFIEQVSYSQEKSKEEKTVITITFLPNKP